MSYINNFPIQFNIPSIGFKSNQTYAPKVNPFGNDSFVTNPQSDRYGSKEEIIAAARSNPRVMEILDEYNIPLKVNEKAFSELKKGHLQETRLIAAKMYSALPENMKKEVNLKDLQEAAMYHDYGKVLIPDNILNKEDQLTPNEWETIQQHSEIGYELLKEKGLSKHTLDLVKYHHQLPDGNGYPSVNGYYDYGIDSQILAAADKYSALTESRSYKPKLSKEEALSIIEEDVNTGTISKEVYTALKQVV